MLLTRLLAAALVVAASGCRPCVNGPWGDDRGAPELEIVARNIDGSEQLLETDGALVDLTFPVQGGHVLFIGARVKNLFACKAELSARLLDPDNGQVAAEEKRQVSFSVAAGGGYGESDVSDTAELANVPVCPNFGSKNLVDAPWNLELSVTDQNNRTATQSRQVVPSCRQDGGYERALCRCECRANYAFGKCTDPYDGGSP